MKGFGDEPTLEETMQRKNIFFDTTLEDKQNQTFNWIETAS